MPELCILDDHLWQAVKDRQKEIRKRYVDADGNSLRATHRKRYLFSGLIKCAECGGGYSIAYRDQFGCSTVKNKGTCSNHACISRAELESRILDALRNQLMDPAMFREFCQEYTREINRLRMEASSDIATKQAELEGDLAGILALAAGRKTPADPGDGRVLLSMVAGVGFEPTTFRL